MSEPNIYENVDKYKGKVKYRNLDPELQKLIGSGGGGSGGSYDDTEIREQIIEVKEDLKEYTNKYAELSTKVNNAATLTDLENYRKTSVDITYYDLDADLKNRIDNPDIAPGIDTDKLNQISEDIDDLKAKNVINESNIQNNITNISSLTENFNEFKQQTEADEIEHSKTIASNTNRIAQLENTIANGIDIDINQLPPEISNKLELVTEISADLTEVQKQIATNTNNIATSKNDILSNKNSISTINSALNSFKEITNTSLNSINKTINEHTSSINDIQEDLSNLSIDSIIASNADSSNPDTGKIKESNLDSNLVTKLNQTTDITNQVTQIENNFQTLGSFVDGDTGNFVCRTSTTLSTKNIFNFIYVGNTTDDVLKLKSKGNAIIYDKSNNILYEATVNDGAVSGSNGEYNPDDVTLTEVTDGLQNIQLNYTLILDGVHTVLYFNNDGELLEIVNFSQIYLGQSWTICVDETTNTLQVRYKDDCIQEWSIDETNALGIETFSLPNDDVESKTNLTQKIVTFLPHSINDIKIDNINEIIPYIKILSIDKDSTSLTKGLYIENSSSCTVAYTDSGLKIANNDDTSTTVKIIY